MPKDPALLDRPLLNAGDDAFTLEPSPHASPAAAASPASPAADDDRKGDVVLPYSCGNELRFFFGKGVPMGLSAILEWGAPPLIAMIFAGHTTASSELQAALGYARVFFNITMLMTTFGLCAYFSTNLPGCIGAGRKDRIPMYFKRSMVMTTLLMLPWYALQFFAGTIMVGVGVPPDIAAEVDVYCRLMVIAMWLLTLELHVESIFVNLGYTKCATL